MEYLHGAYGLPLSYLRFNDAEEERERKENESEQENDVSNTTKVIQMD
jgi:hypothetical protein